MTPPDDDATPQTRRRPLLIGLAGGTAALGAATVGTRIAGQWGGPGESGGRLQLSADSSQMRSLSVRLGDELLPRQSAGTWRSTALATSTHSMVGFTWTGSTEPRIRIRSRVGGQWTPWRAAEVMHDVPDAGSSEASGTHGTHLAWIGASDGIEIQVRGTRPDDLTLVLLEPARLATDRTVAQRLAEHTERAARVAAVPTGDAAGGPAARRKSTVAAPALLTRRDWGADESWRSGSARYNSTIKQVHVHHTASGNDYSEDDVPALLRGFYRYHTKRLGWSDIGYNFLVDRFGRTWVGRSGGPAKPVRGAHTLGFNATSTGVAVIGNFEVATPGVAVVKAIAALAAWKLSLYGGKPRGKVAVTSEGSDKFRTGRVATLPVIDGHRDTNSTACPGKNLYAKLPAIRKRAARLVNATATPAVAVVTEPAVAGDATPGRTIALAPGSYQPGNAEVTAVWLRDGVPIAGAAGTSYSPGVEDLGATLSVQVTAAREGYTALTRTLTAGVVTAATAVVVKSKPRRLRAALRIRVKTPGVKVVPTGTVTVRLRQRVLTLPLDADGRAVARFERVKGGSWPVTVEYAGAPGLPASSATHQVEVLPRKQPRR